MDIHDQPLLETNKELFPQYTVYDKVILGSTEFTAEMMISKKLGLASALQGGRVLSFAMRVYGELVTLYDEGTWYMRIDENDELAKLAMSYFLSKYNRRRPKEKEKELKIL